MMGDGDGAEGYRLVEYALLTVDWLWMVVDGYMEYPSSLPPRRLS